MGEEEVQGGERKEKRMKNHFFKKCNSSRAENDIETTAEDQKDNNGDKKKKLNGWKCMPYIIGNESFERVASLGLTANFTIYLVNHFHMEQVVAAQVSNIFGATTNFAPLIGAFISDAYWGRFRTLAYASVASFLVMLLINTLVYYKNHSMLLRRSESHILIIRRKKLTIKKCVIT